MEGVAVVEVIWEKGNGITATTATTTIPTTEASTSQKVIKEGLRKEVKLAQNVGRTIKGNAGRGAASATTAAKKGTFHPTAQSRKRSRDVSRVAQLSIKSRIVQRRGAAEEAANREGAAS